MRLGAYVLTGDPTWLASSLSRYYDFLDELVVLVPEDHRSWAGHPLPVRACLSAVEAVDHRGIARIVLGAWTDPADVLAAENAQRTAGLRALQDCDWVLQIDNDEVLPDPTALVDLLPRAERAEVSAVEWPMRCLYRRLSGTRYLQVVAAGGEDHFEYPGPVAVRPGVELVDCRRTSAPFLRPTVVGDTSSMQVVTAPARGETRLGELAPGQAIVHNTWGRDSRTIRAKIRSSSHRLGPRGLWYYGAVWLPSPLSWRWLRDVHPFAHGLWPRLRPAELPAHLLVDRDRLG